MTSPDHLGTTRPLQDPTTASPWVPLWRIIEQIASAIGDSREAEHYAKTLLCIRQVAAEGRLRIRGRHEIEVAGQDRTIFSDIYTEIPPAYWKHSVINAVAAAAAFEADRHTNPEKTPWAWGPKGLYEPNCYTGLQLNSDDVSQLIGDVRGAGLLADARSISTETEPLKFSDVVSLKPALWGMSIDLVKAWKWLREGLHSLGREQQVTAFNRLWRDPVWSKVIATGITAGIGALGGVWYFHTQNPPLPATTLPPAIPTAPLALTQQPPQSSPTAAPSGRSSTSEDQTPISWQPDFQMNWYSGPQMAWIRFVGKSTTLAHIKDAYIVSKLTGHREPLEVANATNFNERWNVNQIEPIPPGATTMLVYEPKPPPSIPDFLNQWGAFEFHVVYDGGEYTKIYSQDYVHDKFASELPGIYGPHVTPKGPK